MLKIIVLLIHIMNLLTIFYMIFREKRSANSIAAWTLIIYVAPVIGFILFAFVGRQINQKKMYRFHAGELEVLKKHQENVENRINIDFENLHHKNEDVIRAIEYIDYSPYRDNNEVQMYSDGNEFFYELLQSLKNAKKSINIQFYIFKSDYLGTDILKVLGEKAKEGLEVRLLYDSVGSRGLNKKWVKELRQNGVKTGEFFPSVFKYFNINMNYRNHRKIVVIDGKVGFVGGFNIGDEYVSKDEKFGYWRDTHIKFEGDAVPDLNFRFLTDWRYATKEDVNIEKVLKTDKSKSKKGDKGMQIISSGPNIEKKYQIKLSYLKMIQRAKKYIYIQSPYLVIDNSFSDSLKLAAASGVDVRIMIPGKGDHMFIYWANYVYAGELLKSGVKIFQYDPKAFIHAKTLVIDDEICSIGTANMDTRSFELNFEVNAIVYSEEIARKQREAFEKDMLISTERTLQEYRNRSGSVKAKEAISKLLSGVL